MHGLVWVVLFGFRKTTCCRALSFFSLNWQAHGIAVIVAKLVAHSKESGLPTVIKVINIVEYIFNSLLLSCPPCCICKCCE